MPMPNSSAQELLVVCRGTAVVLRESLLRDFVQARAVLRSNALSVIIDSPVADGVYDNFATALVRLAYFYDYLRWP